MFKQQKIFRGKNGNILLYYVFCFHVSPFLQLHFFQWGSLLVWGEKEVLKKQLWSKPWEVEIFYIPLAVKNQTYPVLQLSVSRWVWPGQGGSKTGWEGGGMVVGKLWDGLVMMVCTRSSSQLLKPMQDSCWHRYWEVLVTHTCSAEAFPVSPIVQIHVGLCGHMAVACGEAKKEET